MQQKERLVSIPKRDLDSLEMTLETLENKNIVKQLISSDRDIAKGRIRKAKDFLKNLGQ